MCLTLCSPAEYSLPGFSVHGLRRHKYWSGLPFPSLRDLPNPGIKSHLLCLLRWQADSLPLSHQGSQMILLKSSVSHSVMSDSLWLPWTVAYQVSLSMSKGLQARILEWVAIPFSRRSSQPRDQTRVSHIAGGFFTTWATREALIILSVQFSSVDSIWFYMIL